jgi:hypothetical protein
VWSDGEISFFLVSRFSSNWNGLCIYSVFIEPAENRWELIPRTRRLALEDEEDRTMRTRWMVGVVLVLGWTTMAMAENWSWQPADDVRLPSVPLSPVRTAAFPTTVYHPVTELTPEYRPATGDVSPYAAVPAATNYAAAPFNYAPAAAPVNYAAPPVYYAPAAAPVNYAAPPVYYAPAAATYTRPAVATNYVAAYAPTVVPTSVVYRSAATPVYPVASYPTPVTVAYPTAAMGPYPFATTVAYTPAPAPAANGPRVWVHPKVYVEGQPIRNLFRAITP